MKKQPVKKMNLSRETLYQLESKELQPVAGGISNLLSGCCDDTRQRTCKCP